MTLSTFIALMPALLGLAGVQAVERFPEVRTVIIEEEVIMRVPVRPRLGPMRWEWVEQRGPKCIPAEAIRGALLSGPEQVDFVMFNGKRIRADLADDCPTLDFYAGFYLNPEERMVCAGRDTVRSRIGGSCLIERFRRLTPRPRPPLP